MWQDELNSLSRTKEVDFRGLRFGIFKIIGSSASPPWRTFWPRTSERLWTSDADCRPEQESDIVIAAAQWLGALDAPPSFEQAVELIDEFARDLFRC